MFTPDQWRDLVAAQEEIVRFHQVELDLLKENAALKAQVLAFETERLKDLRVEVFGINAVGMLMLQRIEEGVANLREKQQVIGQNLQQAARTFRRIAAKGLTEEEKNRIVTHGGT